MSTVWKLLLSCILLHHHHHLSTTATAQTTAPRPPITAMYVFGDSTVDPGNNNYLPMAVFKADHSPYGENFPNRVPTGRFCDGFIATDFVANSVGLKQAIPAYLDPTVSDRDLLTGVSFASAGSGLDDLTVGITRAMDLAAQIRNFEQAVNRMEGAVGVERTGEIVKNAMFLISIGTNDMLLNYFDLPTRAFLNSPARYSDFLINRLRSYILELYKLGARRFSIAGLPPIGCLPIQVSVASILPGNHWLQRVCVEQQNADSRLYNVKLQTALHALQSTHPDARFVYADIYSPLQHMINRPWAYGFQSTLKGCCGTGMLETGSLCNAAEPRCSNPSTYVFWDSIHPTQAAHYFLANALEKTIPNLLN